MFHNLINHFEDIVLQPLEEKDIENLRLLRNKDENRRCFLYQEIISKENQKKWYEKYLEVETDIMFSAYLKNEENIIGYVALYNIDKSKKSCEFGRILVDKSKISQKGIGFQITKCLCEIGFQKLGVDMIYLEVFSDNIPALKTYEKAGFVEKNRYEKDGKEIVYMELYK